MERFDTFFQRLEQLESDVQVLRREVTGAHAAATDSEAAATDTPAVKAASDTPSEGWATTKIDAAAAVSYEALAVTKAANDTTVSNETANEASTSDASSTFAADMFSLEKVIGGRIFLGLGILLVLIAAGYFVKEAFQQWITPAGRVSCGLVASLALTITGMRFSSKRLRLFGNAIIGLGAATGFMSMYAASDMFHLIPPFAALAGVVSIVTAVSAIAFHRKSESLAIFGAVAGFSAPTFLNVTAVDWTLHAGYGTAITVGLLLLAQRMRWSIIVPVLLFGTTLSYFGGLIAGNVLPSATTMLVAALNYAIFAAVAITGPATPQIRRKFLDSTSIMNLTFFVASLSEAGATASHLLASGLLLAAAAGHTFIAARKSSKMQLFLAWAATLFGCAVSFSGVYIDLAFGVAGASLYALGLTTDVKWFRWIGALTTAGALAFVHYSVETWIVARPVFNERFLTIAVYTGIAIVLSQVVKRHPERATNTELQLATPLEIVGHGLAIWGISMDTWDFVYTAAGGGDGLLAVTYAHVAISILWTMIGGVFLTLGMRRDAPKLRREGLALIGAALIKVFFVDLSTFDTGYRYVSAMVVGIIAIIVAKQYQSHSAAPEQST